MLLLAITALALAAPVKQAKPPRPVVVLDIGVNGVVDGLGKDEFDAVNARVAAAFQHNPALVVTVVDRA